MGVKIYAIPFELINLSVIILFSNRNKYFDDNYKKTFFFFKEGISLR